MSARKRIDIYPQPTQAECTRGTFAPPKGQLKLRIPPKAPRWVRAAADIAAGEIGKAIRRRCVLGTGRSLRRFTAVAGDAAGDKPWRLVWDRAAPRNTKDECYEIHIEPSSIVVRAGGWAGLGQAMRTMLDLCDAGLPCGRIADGPRFGIRSMLIHLGYNQWRHTPSKELVYGFSDRLRFDKPVFDEAILLMARLKMNLVILDIGDALKYRSHPEIAVRGALTPTQLRRLLKECRDLGVEPIPKLNFATTHDAWLKEYGKIVGTEDYYEICEDLITELIDLFDGPRFFHIGMDEETIHHSRGLLHEHIVLRTGKAWLDAVKRLDRIVREAGARTWMWGDPLWPDREGPRPQIPRWILLSDWNYSKRKTFPTCLEIQKLGYENIPAGANWTEDENIALLTQFTAKKLNPKKNPGMMMTTWNPTIKGCRGNILNGISLAAGVFWNPVGPSRAPWPRDHYAGTWKRTNR